MFENLLEISCQETRDLLDGENSPILIDCREPDEHSFCHIKGAILVPLSDFARKVDSLFQNTDQVAIVYCHHGVRSLYATQYLQQRGFNNARSMHGGIDAWSLKIDASIARY
jgi:rhodanese-related sulfurtransferase